MAARMAAKIADFVYFSSTPENNRLVQKLKRGLAEFIAVPRREVEKYAAHSDVILMGPGLGLERASRLLVNRMLKKFPDKKFVLDAGALRLVDLHNIPAGSHPSLILPSGRGGKRSIPPPFGGGVRGGVRAILTPHREEFRALFGVSPIPQNVEKMAKKYGCVVVLKGPTDIVCGPRECLINKTGNAGMTKGGTGDVLSGLIAGLACKNDSFLAACAGAYVNGLAGDRLKKRVSYYFSASDLIDEAPKVLSGH